MIAARPVSLCRSPSWRYFHPFASPRCRGCRRLRERSRRDDAVVERAPAGRRSDRQRQPRELLAGARRRARRDRHALQRHDDRLPHAADRRQLLLLTRPPEPAHRNCLPGPDRPARPGTLLGVPAAPAGSTASRRSRSTRVTPSARAATWRWSRSRRSRTACRRFRSTACSRRRRTQDDGADRRSVAVPTPRTSASGARASWRGSCTTVPAARNLCFKYKIDRRPGHRRATAATATPAGRCWSTSVRGCGLPGSCPSGEKGDCSAPTVVEHRRLRQSQLDRSEGRQ